jgi:membrane protein DedA with SNARE-associated domain
MTDLPGVFGTVAPYIEDYGLLAVAVLVFVENLGIPMPGEATLVMAGIYTVSGDLNLVAVLVVGWAAAALGDNAGFAVGRYGGRPLVLRLGRRFGLTHDVLDRVEAFYERHGSKTVAVGRFLPILRHLNGLVAGVTAMTWKRFIVANAIGAAVWVGVWTTAGIQAGSHIETVNTVLERGMPAILVIVVLLLVVHVVRLRRRRRSAMAEPVEDDPPHDVPTNEHEEEHE